MHFVPYMLTSVKRVRLSKKKQLCPMAELFFLWYKKQDTRHKTLKVEQVFIIVQNRTARLET